MMKRQSRFFMVWIASLLTMVSGCTETVPISGRKQLALIPDAALQAISMQEYEKFMAANKISQDTEAVSMVKRCGNNIARAVEDYLRSVNMSSRIDDFEWEFELVERKEVNAFALPGGKVVVYTGLLPVARDETGLAVIIGHEIAHIVAAHGKERMSQALLVEIGGLGLQAAMREKPQQTKRAFLQAYGIGTSLGIILPYSRSQELEADRLGLIFMALAGYDPQAGVELWKRMAAMKKIARQPEFLSTHPADSTRIAQMEKILPEAMQYRRRPGEPMPQVQPPPAEKPKKEKDKNKKDKERKPKK